MITTCLSVRAERGTKQAEPRRASEDGDARKKLSKRKTRRKGRTKKKRNFRQLSSLARSVDRSVEQSGWRSHTNRQINQAEFRKHETVRVRALVSHFENTRRNMGLRVNWGRQRARRSFERASERAKVATDGLPLQPAKRTHTHTHTCERICMCLYQRLAMIFSEQSIRLVPFVRGSCAAV